MTDYINDDEIPVFLINGFLESGKTAFIKYTMGEDYFQIDGRTLLIVCEEGEVEYRSEELREYDTDLVVIEDEADMNESCLSGLAKRYRPERVIIEFNGMWDPTKLRFPEKWVLYQQVTLMDGTTLSQYLLNMRSLMGPMLRDSELCIVNRCDGKPKEELTEWKRKLRPMLLSGSEVIMENTFGEIPLELLPEELPYDIEAPVIELLPEDFGLWFFDAKDNPERYAGKTVHFTAQIRKPAYSADGSFVPGRMAMTCCENDMVFIGFLAQADGLPEPPDLSWAELTAKVEIRMRQEYQGEGPFLKVLEMLPANEIKEPVGF